MLVSSIKWEELLNYIKPLVLDIQMCLSLKKSLNGSLTWVKSTNFHDVGC